MKMRRLAAALAFAGVALILSPARGDEDPAKNLTLDSAIQTAAQQNPELKALEQDAAAAQTKVSKARYWEDPMIGVRFYQVPFTQPLSDTQDIDYIVRQKFPLGGKAKAMKEMAYHEYQHRLHLLSGKGREILRDLKTVYYSLYSVLRQIGVSREIEGQLRALVGSAQGRLATGQVMATDAALGQTEIAKLLLDRQALLQRKAELEAKLNQLMANSPTQEFQLAKKLASPRWELSPEQFLELAQQYQPALQSEKHHIEEKEWGVKAAKREYIPDLQVQTEYVERPGGRPDAFTGELMLNIPLIVKKKSLGVKQAQAELASARYMGQATKNNVEYQLKETYARMQAAGRALSLNRGTLMPQARQAFSATTGAYGVGKIGISDVLSAGRLLLEAQMDYWKAFEDQASSVFALENAVGLSIEEAEQVRAAPESGKSELKVEQKL